MEVSQTNFEHPLGVNGKNVAHNHTQDAQNAASDDPLIIPDSSLQKIWPAKFGYQRGCDIAEGNEALGRRGGNKVEGSRQDNNVENW